MDYLIDGKKLYFQSHIPPQDLAAIVEEATFETQSAAISTTYYQNADDPDVPYFLNQSGYILVVQYYEQPGKADLFLREEVLTALMDEIEVRQIPELDDTPVTAYTISNVLFGISVVGE